MKKIFTALGWIILTIIIGHLLMMIDIPFFYKIDISALNGSTHINPALLC